MGGGGADGRKEWRTVSERVMEAIGDKADELDVNPEEFLPERWRRPRALKMFFGSLSEDSSSSSSSSSVRLLTVTTVYFQTLLPPPPLLPNSATLLQTVSYYHWEDFQSGQNQEAQWGEHTYIQEVAVGLVCC